MPFESAVTCSKCGGEVHIDSRQCLRCGARRRIEISFDDEPSQTSSPTRVLAPTQAAPIERTSRTPAPLPPANEPELPALTPSVRTDGPSAFDRLSSGAGLVFRFFLIAVAGGVALVGFTSGSIFTGLVGLAYAIYLLLGGRWLIF